MCTSICMCVCVCVLFQNMQQMWQEATESISCCIAIKEVALGLRKELASWVLQRLLSRMQVLTLSVLLLAAATVTLGMKVEYWGTETGKLQEVILLATCSRLHTCKTWYTCSRTCNWWHRKVLWLCVRPIVYALDSVYWQHSFTC